ncbi:acyl-CoA dehydrogenase family protein [Actinoplanes sp. NPDC048796]|uniref:acyl-CoA dehydrogenase family protein n=1 Tax=unclassified Actinoplanes TaxID=2626549 RepID=UPI0033C9451A
MPEAGGGLADLADLAAKLIGDDAGAWDRAGRIPVDVLRELGAAGALCAQVPPSHGGPGLSSRDNGELTAFVGSLCSSVRSVMTSQGMAAWAVQRLGDAAQRARLLPELCRGRLAAVAFSEPAAGSDLTAMRASIRREGDRVVVDGAKVWCTAAATADLLVVFGRYEDGAAAVVVPAGAPGVRVRPIADAHGCRAAGHADIDLDDVRLPVDHLLGGTAQALPMLITTVLAYGRMSVAWGSAGILTACRQAAAAHATTRHQSGRPLAGHQLVARHLAELYVAEQNALRACEHASARWDSGSAEMVVATVLAKQVSATGAARGAEIAMQVLASAGAHDGHVVARAHRDAKLMEIIEGSNEICQLILARHTVEALPARTGR